MIELYVNNRKADVPFDVEIQLSKSFVHGDDEEFSYSFELPPTKNNQEIFYFLNKINVSSKYMYRYPSKLYNNNSILFDGEIYIYKADSMGYDCNLVSTKVSELDDLFGDSMVKDVRLPASKDRNRFSIQFYSPADAILHDKNNNDWSQSTLLNSQLKDRNIDLRNSISWIKPYAIWGTIYNKRNSYYRYSNSEIQSNIIYNSTISHNDLLIKQPEQMLLPFFNVKNTISSCIESLGYEPVGNFFENNDLDYLYESFRGEYKDFVERDNQRFELQFTIRDTDTTSFVKQVESYNPLLNKNDDKTPSIKYTNCYLWTIGKAARVEDGTPRDYDSGKGFMIAQDSDKGIEYIKILKSGWYRTAMEVDFSTTKESLISRDKDGRPIDFGSMSRNIWEVQLVDKNKNNKLYSNLLGIDSTISHDLINWDKARYIPSSLFMGSSTNPHTVGDYNHVLGYILQYPLTGNWGITSTILTGLPKLPGWNTTKDKEVKGDSTMLRGFDFIENNTTYAVDEDSFVCGLRFGNYQWNSSEVEYTWTGDHITGRKPLANRNSHIPMMNLFDFRNKPCGTSMNSPLDNVYKHPTGQNPEFLELYSKMNDNNRFEIGTYGGETAFNMVNSKDYGKFRRFNVTDLTPANYLPYTSINESTHYNNVIDNINTDFFDAELSNMTFRVEPAKLNNNVTNSNRDNNTAIEKVDTAYANVSNLVWLDAGQELTLCMAQPMLSTGGVDEEEFREVEAYIRTIDFHLEYIGTSDKEYKPTASDPIMNARKSYMHQYFDDVTIADYIKGIVDMFNLDVRVDKDSKTVSINYFNGIYSNIVDLTEFTDFDSLTFSQNDRSETYIMKYENSEKLWNGTNSNEGVFTSGTEDNTVTNVPYFKPITDYITINGSGTKTYNLEVPVISDKEVYTKRIPSTDRYYMSGSTTPTLFFWSGDVITGWNTRFYEDATAKEYTNSNRMYPIMSTKRNELDLRRPSTIINRFWGIDNENVVVTIKSFIDNKIYNNIKEDTLIRLNDSLYKVKRIESYDINTGETDIILTPYL